MIKTYCRYFLARTKEVFIDGDATTVRTLLAIGSLGWTIGLWLPLETFERPVYAWMQAIASEFVWGLLLLMHFLGVAWRLYDVRPRVYWAFAINLYGVMIWTFIVGCLTFALGEYSPSTAIEICLIIAAWVCLLRTGHNEGRGSP